MGYCRKEALVMTMKKNRAENNYLHQADVRVLGRILAAQNIDFALPNVTRIAEFFAETLAAIPGISSCRVCLEGKSAQHGAMNVEDCKECWVTQTQAMKTEDDTSLVLPSFDFKCRLAEGTNIHSDPVRSIYHHFGFFIYQVNDLEQFNIYSPFIDNLANYVALSLENRLQRAQLQKSQAELESKVEERTRDLLVINSQLVEEIKTRQQTEEALKTSEQQIKRLIESSPVAMSVVVGDEERIISTNQKFHELFGYTVEDIPSVNQWWPLAYPDEAYREEMRARWLGRIQKTDIEPMDAKVTCKDGSIRYVEIQVSSIGHQHIVAFVDFTARRNAEDALEERDRHSQSLLRLSRKFEGAQNYQEVLNAARDEVRTIIGYQNVWTYLLSEDRKTATALFAEGPLHDKVLFSNETIVLKIEGDRMMEEIAETREIVVVEDASTDPRTNKEIVAFMQNRTIVNVPIILFDRHLGAIGMGTFGNEGVRVPTVAERQYLIAMASHMAVTLDRIHLLDRRQQIEQELITREREYRNLVENIPDLIVRYNKELQRVYVNPAWEKASGLSANDVINVHPAVIPKVPNPVNIEYLEKLETVFNTGEPQSIEFTWVNTYGKMLFLEYVIVPEHDQYGQINGVLSVGRDITERKRVEENLRVSEEKYRALAENIPNVVFQCKNDPRYTFVYLNNSVENLTGYSKEEFLENGLSFFDLYHPEDTAHIPTPQQNNKTDINRQAYHITYRIRHKSGEWRWVDEWGTGVTNTNTGEVEYLEGIMVDITDRIRMEDQLIKTNVLLERVFATTESLIAYLDNDFNFIRVNRAYAESAERSNPAFFEGKNHFDLYPNPENEAIFRKVLETGEPYTTYAKPFEYTSHPERGVTYWNWSLLPVKDETGKVNGLVLNLVDVTERECAYIELRQREEQLRLQSAALTAAANAFLITDRKGNIIWSNPAFSQLTGYSTEEIIGKNPNLLKSGRQERDFYETIWKTILSGKVWNGELVNRRKDGSLYTEEMTIAPLHAGSGEISHFIAVKQDISERKRHEREREAIITVSAALRQATKRTEILSIILEQMSALFEAGGAFIAFPHLNTGEIIIEMGRGLIGENFNGLKIPHGMGVSGWVITHRHPYLNNSVHTDPTFYRADLLEDHHCVASVPLIAHEQSIGALWIARNIPITQQDLKLLSAVADIAANAIHRITLHERTEQQLHHLLALHQIDLAITTNFELTVTLEIILKYVKMELNVDAASILLLNNATEKLEYAVGMGFNTDPSQQVDIAIGDDVSGLAALEHRTASNWDLTPGHETPSYTSLLAAENFKSHFATPLLIQGKAKGVLEIFNRTVLNPDQDWLDYFETLATQTAIAIDNASLLQNLQQTNQELTFAYDATIEGWSRALDLRDRDTEGHSQRVTEMALKLAENIGMNETEKSDLRRGALLHDIGKMGVPDAILHKAGKLTESEWNIMRQHPTFAYKMLSPIAYLKRALDISYYHHEKWDGTGYPQGLKGEEIPLAARIFAIVDVFDALTSDRPYRKAWSYEETYRYIEEQSGKHFDPQIVKVFLEHKMT
jgi:PAS domain S-box-containing protein/putative nucleotidyltransferase with HDIG domain